MVAAAARSRRLDLFPRQRRFVLDPARFPGYVGGIGSGKSFAGAAKVLARLGRPELGLVYAPTYPMLRDATLRTLLGMLRDLDVPHRFHKTENLIAFPGSGHEILCRSLDNPDAMRGPNAHYAWVDEASLASREAWNVVIGRVRVGDHPQVWATFTPKGRNWCWEVWEREADPHHPLYRVRTDENPELPADFAASLGYAGSFAAQELGGEFVAFEGLVYPMFSRDRVRSVDCDGWRAVLGVDVGTRNPTAILTVRAAGDGRLHVEREVYRRGMAASEVVAAVRAEADRADAEAILIDPSAAGYVLDLEREGYPVRKADNDRKRGVQLVSTAIADGLTVDPACVNTVAEFESYHYPDNGQGDDPVKQNDHAMDALRYVCTEVAVPPLEPGIW